MNTKVYVRTCSLIALMGLAVSCSKDGFLNKVPSTSMRVPKTLDDMRQILNDEIVLSQTHGLGILSADQFYCTEQFWQIMPLLFERNTYTWQEENVYQGSESVDDWDMLYTQVAYANVVLAGLSKIEKNPRNMQLYETLEGTALFIRSYAFFNVAQVFAAPYDQANAAISLGIPLRLTADVSEKSVRATVEQTYNRIVSDLQNAVRLLPPSRDSLYPNHPSRAAAYAMLARVYLSMRKYDEALDYADSCLQLQNDLIDFNTIDQNTDHPFAATNKETLYQSRMFNTCGLYAGLVSGGCPIDSTLYNSYAPHDLRKSIYFKMLPWGTPTLKGTYYGDRFPFTGLATDEIYLIRAECLARKGNLALAMHDLNTLLRHRWRIGYFAPLTASTAIEALELILEERYKELVLRGQRWTDIRRLNMEGAGITLTRVLQGKTYRLPANDKRYVLLIPDKVIELTGMPQNQR